MKDYINVGCSPYDEDCAQVGTADYHEKSKKECRALINQMKRKMPALAAEDCPVSLRIKSFPHDFGTYHEVVAWYDDSNEEAVDLALDCENLPDVWDEEAKKELASTE